LNKAPVRIASTKSPGHEPGLLHLPRSLFPPSSAVEAVFMPDYLGPAVVASYGLPYRFAAYHHHAVPSIAIPIMAKIAKIPGENGRRTNRRESSRCDQHFSEAFHLLLLPLQ
jgi:hypothetical protein